MTSRDDRDPIPLLLELVRRPSVSGSEEKALAYLRGWFMERGVVPKILGRNLVAQAGDVDGPVILLNAHLDTVPPGPGWTRDPFAAEMEGDRLYGLGANDNKASLAAMAIAFAELAAEYPPARILLAATCDEETGGEGLEWLRPRLPVPHQVLLSEPTDLRVAIAQRGLVRVEATARGRTAHASRPWEGENAIDIALADLARVFAIDLSESHDLLGRATLEVTRISGGTSANVLPGECSFTLDGRPTPIHDNDYFEREIRAALEHSEITTLKRRMTPVVTPDDSPVVRAALRATATESVVPLGGVSDLFFVGDLPAAVLGPGTPEQSHAPDESVSIAATRHAVHIYRETVLGIIGEICP